MAIEIKELRIKVNIVEHANELFDLNQKISTSKLQELKSAIVNECTLRVLEKIKEKAER